MAGPDGIEERVRAWAEARLDAERLDHVVGTVGVADHLARRHSPDLVAVVRLAAWLHDVARRWEPADLLRYAETHGLPITDTERERPMLLHGAVAYEVAARELGLDDRMVRSACAFHTVGDAAMNTTDKILFLADFIEPTRRYPGVEMLRLETERGLDSGVLLAIDMTIGWMVRDQRVIDTRQLELRNLLLRAGVRYESGLALRASER